MLAERQGPSENGFQQAGSHALPARTGVNVNGAFDGEAIAGPGAEIAKGCKSRNVFVVGGDQYRVALRGTASPPRDPFLDGRRTIVVNRGGVGEDFVVDRSDLFEVVLDCVADLHAHLRCRQLYDSPVAG